MNAKYAQSKKNLQQRKQELENDLFELSRENIYEEPVADPADQASASTMEDITISVQNAKREELAKIVKALDMIDDGTYGMCIECSQPISEKRLLLYPYATRCLSCQEALEEKAG